MVVPIKRNGQLFRQSAIVQLNRRVKPHREFDLHSLPITVKIFLRDEELRKYELFLLFINFFIQFRDRK